MSPAGSVARSPLVLVGGGLVVVFILVALLAPWLAPYDPQLPSGPSLAPPSAEHWFGTNRLGQDLFSQVIWGARPSLTVAAGAVAIVFVLATVVGAGAALLGGVVDLLAMRAVDVFLAMPTLPLAILVAALTGASQLSLILVIGAMMWPPIARLVRSQALTVRQRGFVAAARGSGAGVGYVLRRHLAPGVGLVIIEGLVAVAGNAITLQASLAFLGLGDPTTISWGTILHEALSRQGIYFTDAWLWWVLPAGFAIALAILGFTFLGVGLEPELNRRLRGSA